jgi:GNAT superfamily N-acetyltransferase
MIPIHRLGPGDARRAGRAVRAFKSTSRAARSLETFLRNPANYLLVAEHEGEPVGFLVAYRLERADREASQMFVYEVGVATAWRGRRLATALIETIKDLARADGMFEVFVLTSRSHAAARRLYARTGGVVEDDAAILFVYPMGLVGVA